jgi:NAD(P)-dependent dehydrogenase (short-subunit alcohol dehydrogenase family)
MSTVSRQVALVVGGGDAITAAIGRALAAGDFDVAPASEIELSNANHRAQLLENVRHKFQRLDALVIVLPNSMDAISDPLGANETEFDSAINERVKAPYFFTQQVARWMIEQRKGTAESPQSIIIVTPSGVDEPRDRFGMLTIARAGVTMASHLWAHRLAEYGIAVFNVQAAISAERMPDRKAADSVMATTADDIGRTVASLARGEFRHATGSVLNIDGGHSLRRL